MLAESFQCPNTKRTQFVIRNVEITCNGDQAQRIRDELASLCDQGQWEHLVQEMTNLLPDSYNRDGIKTKAMRCVRVIGFRLQADYERRIMGRVQSLLYQVLWFSKAPPNESCQERVRVATAILHDNEDGLHVTIR